MIIVLINAINTFFQVLAYLLIGRAILSWFVRAPYGNLYKIYNALIQITEPMLAPCRSLLARFGLSGTIDFSPILAIMGLGIINRIIVVALSMFLF